MKSSSAEHDTTRVLESATLPCYSGRIIRDARREKKMTQAELASRIGSTKSYISKIENGTMAPSVNTFYRIIQALGLVIEISNPTNQDL